MGRFPIVLPLLLMEFGHTNWETNTQDKLYCHKKSCDHIADNGYFDNNLDLPLVSKLTSCISSTKTFTIPAT